MRVRNAKTRIILSNNENHTRHLHSDIKTSNIQEAFKLLKNNKISIKDICEQNFKSVEISKFEVNNETLESDAALRKKFDEDFFVGGNSDFGFITI